MQNITIIGASSGFGEWLAKFISKNFKENISLTITGRDEDKLKEVANQIGAKYSIDNIEAIKDSDITVFSVPIGFTVDTIKEVAPFLKEGSMVLDVTSVKDQPSNAMYEFAPKGVLVIPTHPMFGPYISTIAGQIFVLTAKEDDRLDSRYLFLKNFLESSEAKVIEATAKEHDKMMAVVQGLTHFDMFVLGETIKRLELDIEKSIDFISPIYKIMISSVARYLNQNPKLYSDIQIHNKEVLEVHKVFAETSNMFNSFVKNKDEENFINTVKETSKYFGEQTKKGQNYTDKIIYMIGKQLEKAHKNIGKKVVIQNIYNEKIVKGKLLEIKNNNLIIEDNLYDIDCWEIN